MIPFVIDNRQHRLRSVSALQEPMATRRTAIGRIERWEGMS